jgi:imidazolonepropionase-like amidohydrolase
MRTLAFTAGLALAAPLAAQPVETVRAIHAGTLIAVPGEAPMKNATIVVRGSKIAEVRPGFVDVPGAEVVDLRTATVMPGFIDLHVHLGGLDDRLQARLQAVSRDYEDEAFTALLNARKTLLAGFTTVRDAGGDPRLILSLRSAINDGQFAGPTVVSAGAGISGAGGHADPRNGLRRDLWSLENAQMINTCNGADDCRRATRDQIGLGADWIKITATGGVLSDVAGGLSKQMTDEEMRAIVETAAMYGRKVAAHSHGVDGLNAALRAGVASIEHGTFTNDETFRLYRQTGAYYVPTLLAPAAALADGERGALSPAQFAKAREAANNGERSFARALREGVNIAFGTDSGVSKHGDNGQEFALMVKNGMQPMAAIKSATVNAATLLGKTDAIGTIEAGKDADIVAVDGDPIANIRELESVDFVMKHGRVHKLAGKRVLSEVD